MKLKKLFTTKSLDDILGGNDNNSRSRSGGGGKERKKSLQVAITADVSSSGAREEISVGERSSSSPEFVSKGAPSKESSHQPRHTKKAQFLRGKRFLKLVFIRTTFPYAFWVNVLK